MGSHPPSLRAVHVPGDAYAQFYALVDPADDDAFDEGGAVSAVRWWRRALADVVDAVLTIGSASLAYVVFSLPTLLGDGPLVDTAGSLTIAAAFAAGLTAALLNHVGALGASGQTLGCAVARFALVDEATRSAPGSSGAFRYLECETLDALTLGLRPLWHPRRLRFADGLCGLIAVPVAGTSRRRR